MCFGNFELTYKGKPIRFSRKKSKEMLAYLIDRRGAMITTDEIRSILWEEEDDKEEKKGYVRVLANDIRKGFETIGADDILINNQNGYGVDVSKISCDYYDFRAKKPNTERLFQGEYMSQYSWAENTLGRLLNKA
jgi:two-component SAPR family response regulator